ncbi:hypothetical protein V6N13_061879 [Hibiscus sabdariffa]
MDFVEAIVSQARRWMIIFSFRNGYPFLKSQFATRFQKTCAYQCLLGKILLITKLEIWVFLVLAMEVNVVCHKEDKDRRAKMVCYDGFSFSRLSIVHRAMLFQGISIIAHTIVIDAISTHRTMLCSMVWTCFIWSSELLDYSLCLGTLFF